MLPKRGLVVCSKAGRDCGKFMVVLEVKTESVLVADGKERRLERPKLKNIKHISLTDSVLLEEQLFTNKSIRRALSSFNADIAKERWICPKRI